MRTILFVALFAVAACVQANEAQAQVRSVQPKPAAAAKAPAVKTAPAPNAAAEIAARPDAFRYYWHEGTWWYFTAQRTWLRWDGSAWVGHHSINDSGAFSPAPAPQPNVQYYDGVAPDGSSFRYEINRLKGGL
ncbi:MAG TPA: hypothetical protein VIK18_01520 [Pirellulales bacterium]